MQPLGSQDSEMLLSRNIEVIGGRECSDSGNGLFDQRFEPRNLKLPVLVEGFFESPITESSASSDCIDRSLGYTILSVHSETTFGSALNSGSASSVLFRLTPVKISRSISQSAGPVYRYGLRQESNESADVTETLSSSPRVRFPSRITSSKCLVLVSEIRPPFPKICEELCQKIPTFSITTGCLIYGNNQQFREVEDCSRLRSLIGWIRVDQAQAQIIDTARRGNGSLTR